MHRLSLDLGGIMTGLQLFLYNDSKGGWSRDEVTSNHVKGAEYVMRV